jgi:hypothetical protein
MRITAALIEQIENAYAALRQQWPTASRNNIVTVLSRPMWDAVEAEMLAGGLLEPEKGKFNPDSLNGSPVAIKEGRGHWAFSRAFPFLLNGNTTTSNP